MSKTKNKNRSKNNKKDKNRAKNLYFISRKRLLSKIIKWDDPILETPCSDVEDNEDKDHIRNIVQDLKDVLLVSENGVGLSASQIGYSKKIFVTREAVDTKNITVYMNAKIIDKSDKNDIMEEGCLSYPGIIARISRPHSITIEYLDDNFVVKQKKLHGLDARIACHEIDHTMGICSVKQFCDKKQYAKKRL